MIMRNIMRGFLDALYPPLCLLCGEISRGIYPHCCETCYDSFEPVGRSCCDLCGDPFAGSPITHLCLACTRKRPPFSWCRGLYRYHGTIKEALLLFKYHGRLSMNPPLVHASAVRIETVTPPIDWDVLVPVPLSLWGSWKRGFNQSHLLALPVARRFGLQVLPDAVKKKGAGVQAGLSAAERIANASASYLPGRSIHRVKGKKVLLFDDIHTTGATVGACARILAHAGAEDVSVLTFARADGTIEMG